MSYAQNYISEQRQSALEAELKELLTKKVPETAQRLAAARELGDLSENAEFSAAAEEMARVNGRIGDIRRILATAELLQAPGNSEKVSVGSFVTIKASAINGFPVGGDDELDGSGTYQIVGTSEADPGNGLISNLSPVGAAVLGLSVGSRFTVRLPHGHSATYEVKQIS